MRVPGISSVSWGRVETDDGGVFKDAKLFPGGAREWDWRETATSHEPGIQPADIEELLEHGAKTILLGVGFHGRLGVCRETISLLEERGVAVRAEETGEAVRLHNELCGKGRVGTLIHSTC